MESDKMLLEIQNQLGRIEATTNAVKEDITELKQKDISQSEDLEKAYAKAKARQDSIRDDLQHQIDDNKTLILTVSESISTLNRNIDKLLKEFTSNIEKKLEGFETKLNGMEARINTVETKKEKTIAKWYDRIVDKIVWIFIIGAIVVLLKWLNAPPELLNQLPH